MDTPASTRHPDTAGAVAFLVALAVPSLLSGAMLYLGARAVGMPLAAALAIGSTALALGFWTAASPLVLARTRRGGIGVQLGVALLFSVAHVLVLVGALIVAHIYLTPLSSAQVLAYAVAVYLPFDVITCFGMAFVSRFVLNQKHLAEARQRALRMQLQPHFLFNALNAAVTLVRRQENAGAIMVLNRLADLLRHVMATESRPTVTLAEEVAFVANYLELERVRFGDRLVVSVDIAPGVADAPVPTLLLQPLVENAVRHGVGPVEGPGRIAIVAAADGATLAITVRDNGRGLTTADPGGTGLGLRNTRERLQQMYGDRASLRVANEPGGGVVAEVRLPL